jgi:ATP-dependent DNA helicase DinG
MDVLELYAFVRPARFCAPSPTGLALSLGLAEPRSAEDQAGALREAAGLLLGELAAPAYPEREAAYVLALTMQRAGRTKAYSSSTSIRSADRGGGVRPSRRAVKEAWATITGPSVKKPSAAPRPILRAPASSHTAPAPGGVASAGGRGC